MEWAEPIAYGALNLKPWEFEQLQPYEFLKMIEGYKWRLDRKEEFAAYFTVAVMNMSGRVANPALRMNDLIDPLRDKTEKKKRDREYLMSKFPKLQQARG